MTQRYTGTLTAAGLDRIHAARDKWMTTGLDLRQPDRGTAEAAVRHLYETHGLPQPLLTIWMDSPLGCVYAADVISQLWGQLRGQLRGQLGGQLGDQLRDQLGDQLWDQLRDQLWGQLGGQLWGQLRGQLRGQLGGQLWGQLRGQLWGQLGGQLGDQLGDQLRDQLGGQLGDQLRDQLGDQLWDQLRDQLWGQLRGQLWGQLRGQLRGQLGGQLGGQLRGQLWGQLGGQLGDQLGDQLGGQLGGQLGDQLWGQLRGQLYDWIWKSFHPWNDAYWLAFYDCALPIAGLTAPPKLQALASAVTELGWWIPMRGAIILSGRPARLCRDASGDLHSADGPALAYPDGWGFHAWHGRRVDSWVIEQPGVERITAEPNVEVRRCAIESLGWDRFTGQAGLVPVGRRAGTRKRSTELADARVPDPGNPGQYLVLYDVPEQLWGSRIRLLMCTNGSPERDGRRRRYGLTVPAHIDDPVEAAAWTAGLAKDQYALMQRRT